MNVTSRTRPFVLIGDPVAHSLSPVMQNTAFRAANVDGVYFALRCPADAVPAAMRIIAQGGGGGNITIPHKASAARALERPTDVVRATGACNTFWFEDGQLSGDNTDVEAVVRVTRDLAGPLAGARTVVIGTGGAARAAVHGLLTEGATVCVLGRSPDSLAGIESTFGWAADRLESMTHPEALRGESFDAAVNATPLGMNDDDALPLDLDASGSIGAVVDLVYRADATAWVRAANDRDIPAVAGLDVLVAQGAAAFRRWWGTDPPVDAMRRAVGLPDT